MSDLIQIKICTILGIKKVFGQREFDVTIAQGSRVRDLLFWMVNRWGEDLAVQLFQPGTDLPLPHVRFMVNGRAIDFLQGMETVLQEGDEFLMLPIVSGG